MKNLKDPAMGFYLSYLLFVCCWLTYKCFITSESFLIAFGCMFIFFGLCALYGCINCFSPIGKKEKKTKETSC